MLSMSRDGSCIPTNLQKLQGSFNNLETNPALSVVGSSAAFWFLAVLCNFQCTRLSTSTEQYPCDSFGLSWCPLWQTVLTQGWAGGFLLAGVHYPLQRENQEFFLQSCALLVLWSPEVFSILLNWAAVLVTHTQSLVCSWLLWALPLQNHVILAQFIYFGNKWAVVLKYLKYPWEVQDYV